MCNVVSCGVVVLSDILVVVSSGLRLSHVVLSGLKWS